MSVGEGVEKEKTTVNGKKSPTTPAIYRSVKNRFCNSQRGTQTVRNQGKAEWALTPIESHSNSPRASATTRSKVRVMLSQEKRIKETHVH
jgi:hypothetical protein